MVPALLRMRATRRHHCIAGTIIGPQQYYLKEMEQRMWRLGEAWCVGRALHAPMHSQAKHTHSLTRALSRLEGERVRVARLAVPPSENRRGDHSQCPPVCSRKKKFVSSLDMALLGIEPAVVANANASSAPDEDEPDGLSGSLR